MSHNTSVRLPEDLYQRLQAQAQNEGRSTNNLMIRLLHQGLNLLEGHSTLGASPKPRMPYEQYLETLGRTEPEEEHDDGMQLAP